MADQKISELTAASTGASADLLHIVQGGTNKKLTVQNLMEMDPDFWSFTDAI